MAMVPMTPIEVRVRCGWFDGRPRSIQLDHQEVPVLRIEQVRHERAAYVAARGPRTVFDVRTPGARLRLSFEHRRRRWLLEALDARQPLSRAA
ncbi:MAG: hypothetical protein M3253_07075 [Chloroflexota bacterium]|nr:hypothetical protein [Chloroflexota bacterium]